MTVKDTVKKLFSKDAPLGLKALRTAGMLCATLLAATVVFFQTATQRKLTDNEKETLREVFKDSVDYDKVRILSSPLTDRHLNSLGAQAQTVGNTIIILRENCDHIKDYSTDMFTGHTDLLHEMTHVWQSQNGRGVPFLKRLQSNFARAVLNKKPDTPYSYDAKTGNDLLTYNVEQQACIVVDYQSTSRYNFFARDAVAATNVTVGDYEKIMANFNKDPSYIRKFKK